MSILSKKTDVCLVLEGTYPYVTGGVSTWTHELIKEQGDKTFSIVAILAPGSDKKFRYELPKNVLGVHNIYLQQLPKGLPALRANEADDLFNSIEVPLLTLQSHSSLKQFKYVYDALKKYNDKSQTALGSDILLNSRDAWKMLLRMYNSTMGNVSFIDYYWSWRALLGGMFSVVLGRFPQADLYHALCTGYAGMFLSKAYLETGKPCLITEHGIYTNERRIEIASAEWLDDQKALNFNVNKTIVDRNLRDFWIDTFTGYSKVCYECCEKIVTLYEDNKEFQIADGADPTKQKVIPNGINYEYFTDVKRSKKHPPTVALIGRVVPIKDVKTFVRACGVVKEYIPDLVAYVMGPTDEDEDYYQECLEIVEYMKLEKIVKFTGMVKIKDYLGKIDVIALTSISEAQPLVILEAGASGIPSVATDVGSCREIIYGSSNEKPQLGQGGEVTPLANPKAVAQSIHKLLTDKEHYNRCSEAIKERVKKYYNKKDQHKSYKDLYDGLIAHGKNKEKAEAKE